MAHKDTTIYLLVSSDDKERWTEEAKSRGISMSQLIRESVNNALLGVSMNTTGSLSDVLVQELRVEIARISEVANLYKDLYTQMAGLKDIQARMLNIAKAIPDEGNITLVEKALEGGDKRTLPEIVAWTGLDDADVYAALQVLIDAGSVHEIPRKRGGTLYEVGA